MAGISPNNLKTWATFLLALHDLGKFAITFQGLRPDLLLRLQNKSTDRKYNLRHDTLGYLIWEERLKTEFQERGFIPKTRGRRKSTKEQVLTTWMATVTGHHGTPPKNTQVVLSDHFEEDDYIAVKTFVQEAIKLLLPSGQSFPELDITRFRIASWWLAGFAVLCDWIGSNNDQFPFQEEAIHFEDYWKKAQTQATVAIKETGLLPSNVSDELHLEQLINSANTIEPTPLQQLSTQLDLKVGPQLYILEDVTGAGKTEAALLLAQRLMATGLGQGIYFGLPTMATANAMYKRLRQGYRQLYRTGAQPSLVLAHSARQLSHDFRQSILPSPKRSDGDYDGDPAASAHCSQWLADNRKKALLADLGIGTVDQALLGILPSRHQSLRLLGLLGKILLIDEVHACDAYMHPLLCRLLQAHAASGGSAILLSATLPQKQRQELADSFTKGLNTPPMPVVKDSYPLLTQVSNQPPIEIPIATRDSVHREVKIQPLATEAAIETEIAEALEENQCACWIRNSVADARETYAKLQRRHPDWKLDLFHARFALADRLDIEQSVLNNFGKHSDHRQRAGRLLISTQVVEQSLDLDFDLLITDLAPIDLIIQRAGRLKRHSRDRQGNPINGPDQRDTPQLTLYAPPWQDNPGTSWFTSVFKRAARVYPDHGQLWLTLKLLRERGAFRMPEDARVLVEGVYNPGAEIPEGLLEKSSGAQGDARAQHSVAILNELKIELGYNDANINRWWDDTQAPTRLGEPTTTIWLARWENNEIKPWRDDPPFSWQQSCLSMRSVLIKEANLEGIPQSAIDETLKTLPAQGKWGILLPLTKENNGAWEASIHDEYGQQTTFHYTTQQGLITEKELNSMKESTL